MVNCRDTEILNASPETIAKSQLSFYKGEQPEWINFLFQNDIKRSVYQSLRMDEKIDSLGSRFEHERSHKTTVKLLILYHYPGTGGTTLCKRLLWDMRKRSRCAVVKSISDLPKVTRQVRLLYEFGETKMPTSWLPVVLLVDGGDDMQVQTLCNSLNKQRIKCVVLECRSTVTERQRHTLDEDLEFCLNRELTDEELLRVRGIVSRLESDPNKRDEHIKNINLERQIIYFGLELFGQQYNQHRLRAFVTSHLKNVTGLEVQLLQFCSLVYKYLHLAIPRAAIQTLLAPCPDDPVISLSQTTSELVLSSTEGCDAYAFQSGYRPAHYLVGDEILSNFQLYDTAYQFLCKMLRRSATYASEIVEDMAVRMFLRRDVNHDFYDGDDEVLENEGRLTPAARYRPGIASKLPQSSGKAGGRPTASAGQADKDDSVETSPDQPVSKKLRWQRFPPLVTDLLKKEGRTKTLNLLLVLCEKIVQNPYVWQHLSRFLAHEISSNHIPREQAVKLLSLLPTHIAGNLGYGNIEADWETSAPVRLAGYSAAVMAIDRAIEMETDKGVFHGTRGTVYKLQLSLYKAKHCSVEELLQTLQIAQLSCNAFDT